MGSSQLLIILWMTARVVYAFAKNGEARKKYNVLEEGLRVVVAVVLLTSGGFFR